MLIKQKYNSIHEIDPEFIPSLEELISEGAIGINSLESYEKNAAEDISFAYFLFFGNQTNSPVGFAQVELKNEEEIKKSFWTKLLKKDPVKKEYFKSAKWQIPGQARVGMAFAPQYQRHAKDAIQKVFDELDEREDILSQEIHFSKRYADCFDIKKAENYQHIKVLDSLIKNKDHYQDYLSSLDQNLQANIFKGFKALQKDLKYKMGEYDHFKESFAYKSLGAKQYKELKENTHIKNNVNSESPYKILTFENEEEIKAMILLIPKQDGKAFYHIIKTDSSIKPILLHQLAIMNFYELSETHKLQFSGEIQDLESLEALGFQLKEYMTAKYQREH